MVSALFNCAAWPILIQDLQNSLHRAIQKTVADGESLGLSKGAASVSILLFMQILVCHFHEMN